MQKGRHKWGTDTTAGEISCLASPTSMTVSMLWSDSRFLSRAPTMREVPPPASGRLDITRSFVLSRPFGRFRPSTLDSPHSPPLGVLH